MDAIPNRDVFLLYNEAHAMFGPTRVFYDEIVRLAMRGGWLPRRAIAAYTAHRSIIDAEDAAAIAKGLETSLHPLSVDGSPTLAADFPKSSGYDKWDDVLRFFRGGRFQIDDGMQNTRVRPWSFEQT